MSDGAQLVQAETPPFPLASAPKDTDLKIVYDQTQSAKRRRRWRGLSWSYLP